MARGSERFDMTFAVLSYPLRLQASRHRGDGCCADEACGVTSLALQEVATFLQCGKMPVAHKVGRSMAAKGVEQP